MQSLKSKIRKFILKKILPFDFYINKEGFCPCCDQNVIFYSYQDWLRDCFLCSNCQSIPRERALMLIIEKYYPNWKQLKIHESSPSPRATSKKLKDNCPGYVGSQFYAKEKPGKVIEGFINQDLEHQTFEDESFNLVITQDVLEHIYDPEKAFQEIGRTLKKGGAHIFTVPIINKHNPTEVWALKGENYEPIFLKTEEYHGNPVDPKGSPVTMHWGYDIVDFIKSKSGLDTKIEYLYDLSKGVAGEFIEVLVSKKQD